VESLFKNTSTRQHQQCQLSYDKLLCEAVQYSPAFLALVSKEDRHSWATTSDARKEQIILTSVLGAATSTSPTCTSNSWTVKFFYKHKSESGGDETDAADKSEESFSNDAELTAAVKHILNQNQTQIAQQQQPQPQASSHDKPLFVRCFVSIQKRAFGGGDVHVRGVQAPSTGTAPCATNTMNGPPPPRRRAAGPAVLRLKHENQLLVTLLAQQLEQIHDIELVLQGKNKPHHPQSKPTSASAGNTSLALGQDASSNAPAATAAAANEDGAIYNNSPEKRALDEEERLSWKVQKAIELAGINNAENVHVIDEASRARLRKMIKREPYPDAYKYIHRVTTVEDAHAHHGPQHKNKKNQPQSPNTEWSWSLVPRDFSLAQRTTCEILQDWMCPNEVDRILPLRYLQTKHLRPTILPFENNQKSTVVAANASTGGIPTVVKTLEHNLRCLMGLFEKRTREREGEGGVPVVVWIDHPSRDQVKVWYDAVKKDVYGMLTVTPQPAQSNNSKKSLSDMSWMTIYKYFRRSMSKMGGGTKTKIPSQVLEILEESRQMLHAEQDRHRAMMYGGDDDDSDSDDSDYTMESNNEDEDDKEEEEEEEDGSSQHEEDEEEDRSKSVSAYTGIYFEPVSGEEEELDAEEEEEDDLMDEEDEDEDEEEEDFLDEDFKEQSSPSRRRTRSSSNAKTTATTTAAAAASTIAPNMTPNTKRRRLDRKAKSSAKKALMGQHSKVGGDAPPSPQPVLVVPVPPPMIEERQRPSLSSPKKRVRVRGRSRSSTGRGRGRPPGSVTKSTVTKIAMRRAYDPNAPVSFERDLSEQPLVQKALVYAGVAVSTLTAASVKELSKLLGNSPYEDHCKYLHYNLFDDGVTHKWCMVPRDYSFIYDKTMTTLNIFERWMCPQQQQDHRIAPLRWIKAIHFRYVKERKSTAYDFDGTAEPKAIHRKSGMGTSTQLPRKAHVVSMIKLRTYMGLFERELRQQGLWNDSPTLSKDDVLEMYNAAHPRVFALLGQYSPGEGHMKAFRSKSSSDEELLDMYSQQHWQTVARWLEDGLRKSSSRKGAWKKELQTYLNQYPPRVV
jgi:hypothetical protein